MPARIGRCVGAFAPLVLVLPVLAVACKRDTPLPASPETVAIAREPLAVGQRREVTTSMMMAPTTATPGATITETTRRREEILAVNGDAVAKARVVFIEPSPGAIAGKTYVVEATNGGLVVRDDTGGPAPPNEAAEVKRHVVELGEPDPIVAALPMSPFARGQRIEPLSKAVARAMTRDGMTAEEAVVTFEEPRGDDAAFDVAVRLTRVEAPRAMTWVAKGELLVSRKTGRPTKMELVGPIGAGSTSTGDVTIRIEARAL